MFNVEKIREDFPILKRKINGRNLVYFDNAATTQKPKQVLNFIKRYYYKYNANVHRAIYKIASEATHEFEKSRKKVAKFINSKPEEIIWTRGTTESINFVLYGYALKNLKEGDEVLLSIMEHHSNIVPWQFLQNFGIRLKYLDINEEGRINIEEVSEKITSKTKLVCITHCSNVLGTLNDVKEIAKIAHERNALCLVDGAQSVPHMPINVKDLDIDFLAFSGHKMLAPTGIGVLYAKKEILEDMEPFIRGSEQIKNVDLFSVEWNSLPWKFEAGTPNISGAIALGKAVDYLRKLGMENVFKHEMELTKYALEKMNEVEGLRIIGPKNCEKRLGLISFVFKDLHPHDIAHFLDSYAIAIRSGHHCALPLMKRLNLVGTSRISFYFYNTKQEIDYFFEILNKIKETFGK